MRLGHDLTRWQPQRCPDGRFQVGVLKEIGRLRQRDSAWRRGKHEARGGDGRPPVGVDRLEVQDVLAGRERSAVNCRQLGAVKRETVSGFKIAAHIDVVRRGRLVEARKQNRHGPRVADRPGDRCV